MLLYAHSAKVFLTHPFILWNRWVPNRTFAVPKDYYNLGVSNLSFEPHKEHLVSLLILDISDGRSSPASDTTPGMIFLNTCKTRYETTNFIYMHSAKLKILNLPQDWNTSLTYKL
jgi:hypothetical protein